MMIEFGLWLGTPRVLYQHLALQTRPLSCGTTVLMENQHQEQRYFYAAILQIFQCQLSDGHKRTIRNLSWNPAGNMLASASFDGTAGVWQQEIPEGEFEYLAQLEGHESEVKSVAWSYDGQFLATCSRDKTIWIWEINDENEFDCVAVASGHTQDVKFVKWHPHRNQLFSSSYDDTIKSWKLEESIDDWVCSYTMEGHESTVWGVDFDRTGNYMVSCGEDKNWMIWKISETNFENKGMISNLHSRSIYSCSWAKVSSPGSTVLMTDLIATGGADNKIMVYEINCESLASSATGSFEFNIVAQKQMAHQNDVNSVTFHPKNPLILASCSDDGKIKLWKVVAETQDQQQEKQEQDQIMENANYNQ
ncbi:probable cytosolic iron-sulfur protein assembly protein ciao1 [Stylonychia lemnae]|uniref:Probable cytosolic iron-sulfur protein assembly protein CIAO1 homolog n=1 Tax=Stylonychia lemnae TaxID=5949 RepID=A0A078B1M6_STYLE|nr:probable cytosolic iron-sulfur protein assembly protein ciao1 [Stylonychia lemnae]|eukprot:CDW87183.1 probable cytosolic iron-sulfur protein assembly protein ciao1 [Stylonychia lemnae]